MLYKMLNMKYENMDNGSERPPPCRRSLRPAQARKVGSQSEMWRMWLVAVLRAA